MLASAFQDLSHRRRNALTGEWVIVSPHRNKRPWQGKLEPVPEGASVAYDAGCYLCPGNERAGGARNEKYTGTYVFDNDFAALLPTAKKLVHSEFGLLEAQTERGLCRVMCFSPDHSQTLAKMDVEALTKVVLAWSAQFTELSRVDWIHAVQIFENRGEMMGCSNPHPHCQIWATQSLPNELMKEDLHQRLYFEQNGRPLLQDYLEREVSLGERIVCRNPHFVALVPFWAIWPFELMVLPVRPMTGMDQLTEEETVALASILREVTARYDALFGCPFPYSMGFHQRPVDGPEHPHFTLHAHFYPPLLRSATVRKFLVGFEMLASPQRDITPESAAAKLRELRLPK